MRLSFPTFGHVEKLLSINRFFHVLNLMYVTGGNKRVEDMLEAAGKAVSNVVLRADLMQTVAVIKSGGDLGSAFSKPAWLDAQHKSTIAAGEHSGSLEKTFQQIAQQTDAEAKFAVDAIGQIYYRVFIPLAALSIVSMIVVVVRTLTS